MQTSIEQIAGIRHMLNTLEERVLANQRYLQARYYYMQGYGNEPEGDQVRLAITNAEIYSIEEIIRKVSHKITGTDEISPRVWESCDSF
jgi:hypothetical protein